MADPKVTSWMPGLLGPVKIQSNGSDLTPRSKINFVGTATDNPENDSIDVAAGGGGATSAGANHAVQTSDGAGGLSDSGATCNAGALACTSIAFSGAGTYSTIGAQRFASGAASATMLNAAGTHDLYIFDTDGSDELFLGIDKTNTSTKGFAYVGVFASASGRVELGAGATVGLRVNVAGGLTTSYLPIALSASAAASGDFRLAYGQTAKGLNQAGTHDAEILSWGTGAADVLKVGGAYVNEVDVLAATGGQATMGAGIVLALAASETAVTASVPLVTTHGRIVRVSEKNKDYTLTDQDEVCIQTASGHTFTLPASPANGARYEIHHEGTGTLTVDGNGHTIGGASTETLSQYESRIYTFTSTSGVWLRV
jgi:hypothetical protein